MILRHSSSFTLNSAGFDGITARSATSLLWKPCCELIFIARLFGVGRVPGAVVAHPAHAPTRGRPNRDIGGQFECSKKLARVGVDSLG